MPIRIRQRRSLGNGFNVSISKRGPRVGYRRGRASVSEGTGGSRFGFRLFKGVSWRNR